jgi:hypothetical protein
LSISSNNSNNVREGTKLENGYRIKPVTPAIAIGYMLPGAHDLMDQALKQWEEHKKQVQEMTNGEYPKDEVCHFAYWLFRWSGLIQYQVGEEGTDKP